MGDKAVKALLDYRQADEDGIMVLTSRQAIHEVVDAMHKAEAENVRLHTRVEKLTLALKKHHNWHLDSDPMGVPDGEGGFIEIDMADSYSDSGMCDLTIAALSGDDND